MECGKRRGARQKQGRERRERGLVEKNRLTGQADLCEGLAQLSFSHDQKEDKEEAEKRRV